MGRFIKHTACPCGRSKDNLAVYDQGDYYDAYCWTQGCGKYFPNVTSDGEVLETRKEGKGDGMTTVQEIKELPFADIPDRGIRKEICEKYGVRVEYDAESGEIAKHYYPIHKNNHITGYFVRELPRKFKAVGDAKGSLDLFGRSLVGDTGKLLIVTEGHLDALAAFQMLKDRGRPYRVVSVPNGANISSIRENIDWLENFETILFCGDQDEPGRKFTKEASELLTPGKAKIAEYSEKDPSDMLLAGKHDEFWNAICNSTTVRPDGIVSIKDTYERLTNRPQRNLVPYPESWELLQEKTKGLEVGALDTWTAGTSIGKSLFFKIMMHHLWKTTDENIGAIYLEEPIEDTIEDMMGIEGQIRLRLPDVKEQYPPGSETYDELFHRVADSNRLHFFDHWGSIDEDSKLLNKIRYLARGLGCKFIFLDHLSIVVSEFANEGDERTQIDSLMSKLKRLTQELGIWLGLIVHLRKSQNGSGKSFEEGAVPTLDDLRGSSAIKQLSNNVFGVARNLYHPMPEGRMQSEVHVLKCRLTGFTGPADTFQFDPDTGILLPVKEGFDEDVPDASTDDI